MQKANTSCATNTSLSLHIAAYENAIECVNRNRQNNGSLIKKQKNASDAKFWKQPGKV